MQWSQSRTGSDLDNESIAIDNNGTSLASADASVAAWTSAVPTTDAMTVPPDNDDSLVLSGSGSADAEYPVTTTTTTTANDRHRRNGSTILPPVAPDSEGADVGEGLGEGLGEVQDLGTCPVANVSCCSGYVVKPYLPRICSRTLMDCVVPSLEWGGTKHPISDLSVR